MFGFLNRNKAAVSVVDKIWLSQEAKWKACIQMAKAYPSCVFVVWFEATKLELEKRIKEAELKSSVALGANLKDSQEGSMYIFAEHYPLSAHEQSLYIRLKLKEAPVLSSLDEPLFLLFFGDRMINVVKKLGMQEDEIVGHPMITKAINRAQAKIKKSVISEIRTSSQMEWFEKNVKTVP